MRTKIAGALLFASIAACGVVEDETTTETQNLYGSPAWFGGTVPVCWENPDAHMDLQIRVREILRETWESYTTVSFIGPVSSEPFGGLWPPCSEAPGGRRVEVSFSEEADYRGWTIPAGHDNSLKVILISDRALAENFTRFRYEVIHEFGHALGFQHEQQRPDNWTNGTADQCPMPADVDDPGNYNPVYGGINWTPTYDANSVMNYCNPAGYPQDLSLGDISGARAAYGRRDVKGDIYRVDSDYQLHWYRHDGRTNGADSWGYPSGNVVGTGWDFKHVFSAAGSAGILYTIDASNQLAWRRHDGRVDGKFRWAPGAGNVVGYGWDFTQVFGADKGVIYGITPYTPAHIGSTTESGDALIPESGGELKWYRHDGRNDGSFTWGPGSGNTVGTGWNSFKQAFSGGDGVIYAITPYVPAHASPVYGGGWIAASGGELKWYRHTGQSDGTKRWAPGSGATIGWGWGDFKAVFSGGDGVIYAVDSTDQLRWYRHDGRANGARVWAPGSGNVVRTGFDFENVVGDD
ncbi:MAG TPA: tachylectin-related carbohydrate-binding protein [Kofleriaceae bacterium]|nr:tachylectin-related carbohydrate-binding protein [Kofleriaceae bacterium]